MKFLRFLAIALVLLSVNIASATSTYSDRLVGVNSGIAIKVPVKVLTKTAITLTGEQTIDDVNCVDGDRVLVTANGVNSGIYVVHTGTWTRALDWNGPGDIVSGTRVAVSQGSLYAGTTAYVTTTDPITIGTTNLTFEISLSVSDAVAASELPQAAGNKRISLVKDDDGNLSLWASDGIQWKKVTEKTNLSSPTVTSVSPTTGNIEGGYTATVYGSNFAADSVVRFGGATATVIQNNGSSITVTVPAHSAGVNNIDVTSPLNVTTTLSNAFTYTESTLPLPVISAIDSGTPTTTEATITFTTDVNCSSYVEWGLSATYNNSNFPGHATVDQISHSHTLTSLTPETTYHYRVTVIDINNNVVSSADGTFLTATPVTFPVISAIDSGTPTVSGATITWTTDIAATSIVEYGPTNAYGYSTTLDPTLVTSHSVAIAGLTDNSTYHYRVKSISEASAETVSADETFATAAVPGTTTINTLWNNSITPASSFTAFVTVGTAFKPLSNGNITGVKYYKYAGNPSVKLSLWSSTGTLLATTNSSGETASGWQIAYFTSPVAVVAETKYVVSCGNVVNGFTFPAVNGGFATGLTVDQLYAYSNAENSPGNGLYISEVDGFPNLSSNDNYYVTPVFEYTTGAVTGLGISNINASNITKTSATINWTLTDFGTGYYEIGTTQGVYTITNNPGQNDLTYSAHGQNVTGLTPNTTYYYRVRSTNGAGTETISQVNTFTTLADTPTGTYHAPPPTSSLVVNVRDKGATGNGVTDDTLAIQTAINQVAGTGGTVLVPAGTYVLTVNTSTYPNTYINLGSNMTFKMEAGAILKLTGNASYNYSALTINNKTNVNVIGGDLWGERNRHLTAGNNSFTTPVSAQCPGGGTGQACFGEWGMGIWITGPSSNIYIEGVKSREMWGDGFYVEGNSTNVNFYSVVADNNRRQGMSLINVNGFVVRDSIFQNTLGNWPQAGIDMEADVSGEFIKNGLITNNQFYNNNIGIEYASLVQGSILNVATTNNIFNNNRYVGIRAVNTSNGVKGVPNDGNTFSGNTFFGNAYMNGILYTWGPGGVVGPYSP